MGVTPGKPKAGGKPESTNGSPNPGNAERAEIVRPDPAKTDLYEVAWEVCNQVGGIYQVIRSKARAMMDRWGDRYTLIGPYEAESAAMEFRPTSPVQPVAGIIDELAKIGIKVHHGRWLVAGEPRVLLIEHWRGFEHLNQVKFRLWERHGIQVPDGDPMLDGVVSFADAVRELLWRLSTAMRSVDDRRLILAQFHEWMSGLTVPMLRHEKAPIGTVFTTHATLLGRYIASGNPAFYDHLPGMDGPTEAARYNIRCQHAIETACARSAHVFTTVSPITAEECKVLLGREPDVVTPNGLNMDRYTVGHEFQTLHAESKARIHQFTMGHFFPSYSFNLDNTLYMFTSGRYEPANKGFDLCLEAMARLNAKLRASGSPMTVVFFIVSRRPTKSLHPRALESRGVLYELDRVCDRIAARVREQLTAQAAAGEPLSIEGLIDDYWALRYRRTQAAFKSRDLPMITTHFVEDDDPVINHIRHLQLFNRAEDRVKVVYHPDFISPANPLWGVEYDQFVRGCHLGIFPSAYEPWGYTPLESIAMGVPAVTSDLAGFGRYVQDHMPDHDEWGVEVLERRGKSFNEAAASLADKIMSFCRLDRRGRIGVRNAAEARSSLFDWSELVGAYHKAHNSAFERVSADITSTR